MWKAIRRKLQDIFYHHYYFYIIVTYVLRSVAHQMVVYHLVMQR